MTTLKWDQNFNITYKITVGTRDSFLKEDYTQDTYVVDPQKVLSEDERSIPSNAVMMGNVVEEGYNVRGFTFKLDTNNKLTKSASTSETTVLTLYNLDAEVVDIINQDKCVVIVEAGFQGKTELAYTGDVVRVKTTELGSDAEYHISCKSGGLSMRNTIASLHYDETLSLDKVIEDMASRLPATALGATGMAELRDRYRNGGRNYEGSVISFLDKIAEDELLDYAHFNGKIIIVPFRLNEEDKTTFTKTTYTIKAQTIKNITDNSDKQGIGTDSVKTKKRKLQVNTFFIPIELGQFITIQKSEYTKDYTGTYQVKGLRHILRSDATAFDTVVTVEEV